MRHWVKFGTGFFYTRPADLTFTKYLCILENNLFSFGQTQPRRCNFTSQKLSHSPTKPSLRKTTYQAVFCRRWWGGSRGSSCSCATARRRRSPRGSGRRPRPRRSTAGRLKSEQAYGGCALTGTIVPYNLMYFFTHHDLGYYNWTFALARTCSVCIRTF